MGNDSELIIGIVSTVGTNSKKVIEQIDDALNRFGYKVEKIKVSKEILGKFAIAGSYSDQDEFMRANYFMDLGDKIRGMTYNAVLMEGVTAYIAENIRMGQNAPIGRVAYIIDSIKHPDEVAFLRRIYGDGFHLIGISANEENRIDYLSINKNMSRSDARKLIDRDNEEAASNGQHTRDAFQEADYFIDAGDEETRLRASVFRLFDLLFGNPFITPTFGEYAMFRAYVASLRSADLSRQIGAVVTRGEEIMAEGVNDCPKATGGLYWPRYSDLDKAYVDVPGGRDHTLGYDSNKRQQSILIENILAQFNMENTARNRAALKKAGIGQLTEYGRVVHAEMESLMMCARIGMPTVGCEMYVTTFPCHNCAKHIIAAGIKRVVYIEPYPKSKAREFYDNEIECSKNDSGKVRFTPFYGVSPHRFVDLFSMKSTRWRIKKRKDENGDKIDWKPEEASLRNPMSVLSYVENEMNAALNYANTLERVREELYGGNVKS